MGAPTKAARRRAASIDQPFVQQNLARCQAHIEVLKLMNWKQAWASRRACSTPADASAAKVFGTEMAVQIYEWMMEVIGEASTVRRAPPRPCCAAAASGCTAPR